MNSLESLITRMLQTIFGPEFYPKRNNPIVGLLYSILNNVYKTDGCRFYYPKNITSLGFRSRFFFDIYEKEERELIKKYISEEDRILELGGCIGVVSCIANRLLKDPYSHVVVEANPELIPTLNKNKELNNAGFIIEHCIIGSSRYSDFFVHELIVGGSRDRKTKRKTEIVSRSLNELLDKHGDFSVLLIDIEGGEYDFIMENIETIRNFSKIIIELHDFIIGIKKVEELKEILQNLGFSFKENIGDCEVWLKNH